ncbi:hydroxyacid dehydrogenase [Streptomyces sp. P9-2]|uniref:hydroxyacid dehydrogenase n=1 Tax=Streptomyces sp. P9-2 TaxID=3423201 RepID=UPI003F7470FD
MTEPTPGPRPRVALAMSAGAASAVLGPESRAALDALCGLAPTVLEDFTIPAARAVLADVELLVTGWGCPPLDDDVLRAAPRLRAVVHTAGSVRGHVTDACWDRGVEVSSAAAANAVPVAEYTLAMILLTGKRVLESAREYRASRTRADWLHTPRTVGNHRRTVGILSASLIGRRVIDLLRPHDVDVLLHDPYVDEAEAARLGVRGVGLAELFRLSDTVSVHTPLLPQTRGLVSRELIGSMRPGAVLINTARGAVLDQDALTDAALAGRIRAVLDVTEPEVLPPDHPLWDCDHVLITPHLAGSQGNEWRRLADTAVSEVARWAAGEGFLHPVRRERLGFLA